MYNGITRPEWDPPRPWPKAPEWTRTASEVHVLILKLRDQYGSTLTIHGAYRLLTDAEAEMDRLQARANDKASYDGVTRTYEILSLLLR
jgi:hypothetical protein